MSRFYLVENDSDDEQEEEQSKVYLYVPYLNRHEAKHKGCKFDGIKKQWFVTKSNPKYQECIDIFHKDNFKTELKQFIQTEEERMALKIQSLSNKAKYDDYKKTWKKSYGGSDIGFNKWYGENVFKK
jgi:hypothetical protein